MFESSSPFALSITSAFPTWCGQHRTRRDPGAPRRCIGCGPCSSPAAPCRCCCGGRDRARVGPAGRAAGAGWAVTSWRAAPSSATSRRDIPEPRSGASDCLAGRGYRSAMPRGVRSPRSGGTATQHLPAVRPWRGDAAVLVGGLSERRTATLGSGQAALRRCATISRGPRCPGRSRSSSGGRSPAMRARLLPRGGPWKTVSTTSTLAARVVARLPVVRCRSLICGRTSRSWALVLTHDVETMTGHRTMGRLRDAWSVTRGLRSWGNFVSGAIPRRGRTLVRALQDEGCEVGVHGLRHDGRDLGSRRLMRSGFRPCGRTQHRWHAVGFRPRHSAGGG